MTIPQGIQTKGCSLTSVIVKPAISAPRSPNKHKSGTEGFGMSKNDGRSDDGSFDMLCPICEDACSCAGQTVLTITAKRPQKKKTKLCKSTLSQSGNTKKSQTKSIPSSSHSQSSTKSNTPFFHYMASN